MTKVLNKKYLVLGLMLGALLIILLIVTSLAFKTQNKPENNWVIRSVEDRVVLMNNGEVVEVFGDIVIDTLPNEDKKHLEMGIHFLTKDEAMTAIEDYDG